MIPPAPFRIGRRESEFATRIEQESHRAAVVQLDFHVLLKASGCDIDCHATQFCNESPIELIGLLGASGPDEAGTSPFRAVSQKSELADDEDSAADLLDREIHLAVMVLEDAESGDFLRKGDAVGVGVIDFDSEKHEQAGGDFAGDFLGDGDLGSGDTLNNCSHDDFPCARER